jgi:PD-(D/E)XK nuclease superfamily protein
VLTTDQKGAVAEAAIAHAAIELGFGVSRPLADERYDFIFDLRPRLLRIQCKWALRYGDVVIIRCHRLRRTAAGLFRRLYEAAEVDAFAASCAELRRCYFSPIEESPLQKEIRLRLSPTRNNQSVG